MCPCNHEYKWTSSVPLKTSHQERLSRLDMAICVATGIFGCSTDEFFEILGLLNIHHVTPRTVYKLWPIFNGKVAEMYKESIGQARAEVAKLGKAFLLGDAQFESPGFTAGKATYVMGESSTKKVLCSTVFTKEMSTSSSAMEVDAAEHLLDELDKVPGIGENIKCFTTDGSTRQGLRFFNMVSLILIVSHCNILSSLN